MRSVVMTVAAVVFTAAARGQLPPPPSAWADWDTAWHADDPGELAADGLLDAPAGHRGGVVARDGHFYSGDHRVRFWGVNLAFGANFPTHDMADRLARRFARYGINAVRFHHMDMMPFPGGIFADGRLERLSPEALDRLDYFVAALKSRGVYADLNLHVSRSYTHGGPRVDKIADLFVPALIASQKRYARDVLTHVNGYTHVRYADEAAVGLVEINNENSLFMWGAERTIAELPEPYAGELRRQWNGWLAGRYGTRAKVAAAWAGTDPAGPNLVQDAAGVTAGRAGSPWHLEQHGTAAATIGAGERGFRVRVSRTDGVGWHVQANQAGIQLARGRAVHVRVAARSDRPTTVTVSIGQAHEPWQTFGSRTVRLGPGWQTATLSAIAPADEANARLTVALGDAVAAVDLADFDLHAGGPTSPLADDEDPATGTVRPHAVGDDAGPRHVDWLTFLEQTEERYYDDMRTYLHRDLGVRCPITGTIGFGPLGTYAQRHMDFVDAHAYWQHPTFPGKSWDPAHWAIPNTPMVDDPAHATLWSLAATRVAGKPFTVTEYQHPAPNDWAAECVPEIASFAAMQDWDGVFLFAYSHDDHYDKGRIASFFDVEGNPTKMPLMPIGARLFLGGAVPPVPDRVSYTVTPAMALAGGGGTDMAAFLDRHVGTVNLRDLYQQTAIRFSPTPGPPDVPHAWAASAPPPWRVGPATGTGRITLVWPTAAVHVGFGIEGCRTPFSTIVVVPADPSRPMTSADKLLVTAAARARNTDIGWNADRTSVGNDWGHAPVQVEVVHADVTVPGRWSHAWALDAAGRRTAVDVAEAKGGETVLHLGRSAALASVVER